MYSSSSLSSDLQRKATMPAHPGPAARARCAESNKDSVAKASGTTPLFFPPPHHHPLPFAFVVVLRAPSTVATAPFCRFRIKVVLTSCRLAGMPSISSSSWSEQGLAGVSARSS
ncbi:hypothetical protein D9611_003695 [Ephemerocybe angulata]|uniref:Uncharacterized protein n=1 Tax=Ephemerocybe angulata TaxID=980116 RepID=A0A8H5B589_9AGAR|nr:hypothetical protein D9611_003695 [Tulosesus angulatus]